MSVFLCFIVCDCLIVLLVVCLCGLVLVGGCIVCFGICFGFVCFVVCLFRSWIGYCCFAGLDFDVFIFYKDCLTVVVLFLLV